MRARDLCERLPEVAEAADKRLRTTAPIARVERVKPITIEVVGHLPHGVRVAEHHLADRRRGHRLRGQQHDLRPPPGHDRSRRAQHDPQKPLTPSSLVLSRSCTLAANSRLRPLAEGYENQIQQRPTQPLLWNRQTLLVTPLAVTDVRPAQPGHSKRPPLPGQPPARPQSGQTTSPAISADSK